MSSRAIVLNCPIDLCTKEEALECARLAIEANTDYQIITINPEMIMNAQKNEAFFIHASSFLSLVKLLMNFFFKFFQIVAFFQRFKQGFLSEFRKILVSNK